MKFLVIGLGSMGKRRIRNLKCLKEQDIIGFDSREDRRLEAEKLYGIKIFDNIEDAFKDNPNAIIVSTPPSSHKEYIVNAINHHKPVFTELNIIDEDLHDLGKKAEEKNVLVVPSTTPRHYFAIKKIKELISDGKIGNLITIQYHVGQYLPDWHPWEHYTDFFVSNKKTHACREIMAFELNWLTWIFGRIVSAYSAASKRSDLNIEINDYYHVLLKFENGVICNLLVDIVSRFPERRLTIIGDKGTIIWDKSFDALKIYYAGLKSWNEIMEEKSNNKKEYVSKEKPYIEEIEDFIDLINLRKHPTYSIQDELIIVKVLDAIEESVKKESVVLTK